MQRAPSTGTRFRIFPQAPFLHPELLPEIVAVSKPPGSIGPGPADDRIYVIDPIGKGAPYGLMPELGPTVLYLPPWSGAIRPPALPGPDGHFDHLPVGTPDFALAHLYGTTRFVMDVWERYLGGTIPWHFQRHFRRLEITILPTLDNARAGYGYM
ncbi:MAG TPA: hypothetical protein VNB28_03405, partial [Methylomirabilota bacterium]|nr:hypothetical protein [Methylomirabilota bacterium]